MVNGLESLRAIVLTNENTFKNLLDSLISNSFTKSMNAIMQSINQKDCYGKVVYAIEDLFNTITVGTQQCTNLPVDLSVIMSELQYGFSAGLDLNNILLNCIKQFPVILCLTTVSNDLNLKQL